MIKDTSKQMAKVAVEALKEKKGYDVKVIDISEISILADYFIIANGSNANQVQAMVDNVEEQMYKAGFDDPYEVRDSQETRYRQAESMGMGKHQ